jgi:molybdenum cofactor cytidylyltransferase
VTHSAARNRADVACILLAAGGSSRLGQPKQLARHGVQTLLQRAIAAARGALPAAPLIVVVGANAARLRAVVMRAHRPVRIVTNAHWAGGMASSLQAGIAAVPRSARAALVLVVDQPHLGTAGLARLLRAWRRRPGLPAAARYDGRAGVPAVLPRRQWRKVRGLQGDQGARALLRGSDRLTLVDIPEASFDVDTLADVEQLRSRR